MDKTDILVSEENRHLSRNNNNISNPITSLMSNNNNRDAFDMNDLLTESQVAFNHIINTQIVKMLKNAKGVAFIKLAKGSSGVGDFRGRGIVMKHNVSDDEWCGPCAVNVCGVSMGVELGVNEICSIFVINDESVFSCLLQNNCDNNNSMAGNEFTVTVGSLADNSNSAKIVSYSFAKGVFIDFPLEKIKITINNNVNHHYYQNEINPEVIFSGNIKSFDNQYFELSRRLIDTVNNANVSSGQRSREHGKSRPRYQLNMNAPLYQYYVENNKNEYTYQQLLQLPALPFLGDIRVQKYKLSNVKGWIVDNKAYRHIKNLLLAKKFTMKHDDNKTDEPTKYMFSENAPLYQYYTSKCVECNSKQLNCLPKFPYLNDVRHYHKYNFLTKINPMNFISGYKSKMSNDKVCNKYVFDEVAPLFQYYNHSENSKDIVYNYQMLSKLPRFPFLDDIKSNKIRFRQYNPINIIKNKMRIPKFQRKHNDKSVNVWYFDEKIPMCQYYMKNDNNSNMNEGVYDHQQLSSLPKLPYLKDINSTKVKLNNYNPVNFVKRLYRKYVGSNKQ